MIYDEEYMKTLQQKNEEKLKAAVEKLGDKWLLHPSNHIKRKTKMKRKSK